MRIHQRNSYLLLFGSPEIFQPAFFFLLLRVHLKVVHTPTALFRETSLFQNGSVHQMHPALLSYLSMSYMEEHLHNPHLTDLMAGGYTHGSPVLHPDAGSYFQSTEISVCLSAF